MQIISRKNALAFFATLLLFSCLQCAKGDDPQGSGQTWIILSNIQSNQKSSVAPLITWYSFNHSDLMEMLNHNASQLAGIVIPIFRNGAILDSNTSIPSVKSNSSSHADSVLNDIIKAAHSHHVRVILSLDLFCIQSNWQGIFQSPLQNDWLEVGRNQLPEDLSGNRYISPFHPDSRAYIEHVVKDVAVRYPKADGILLDASLSNTTILGFSDFARSSAIASCGVDPFDLNFFGNTGYQLRGSAATWASWRSAELSLLFKQLVDLYRINHPGGKVYLVGNASYYDNVDYYKIRSGVSWLEWMRSNKINGAFIRDNWISRSAHLKTGIESELDKHTDQEIVPIFEGLGHIEVQRGAAFQYAPSAHVGAVSLSSKEDMATLDKLLRGGLKNNRLALLNTPIEDYWFQEDREIGSSHLVSGVFEHGPVIALIGNGVSPTTDPTARKLLGKLTEQRLGIGIINISDVKTKVLLPGAKAFIDPSGDFVSMFPRGVSLAVVDYAGFLRSVHPVVETGDPILLLPKDLALVTTQVDAGGACPNFIVTDCTGNNLSFSQFAGKNNVLLTFFPACADCSNQLLSLKFNYQRLKNLDTSIIAISPDDPLNLCSYASANHIPFPLVADRDMNLARLFGAVSEDGKYVTRRSILIDKKGRVRLITPVLNTLSHGEEMVKVVELLNPSRSTVVNKVQNIDPPRAISELPLAVVDATGKSIPGSTYAHQDFGTVSLLDSLKAERIFILRNISNHPITITRLEPSCSCTLASVLGDKSSGEIECPVHIPAGKTLSIRVAIDLTAISIGPIRKAVYVFVEGVSGAAMDIELSGNSSNGILFAPKQVDFGRPKVGEDRSVEVAVTINSKLSKGGEWPFELHCTNPDVIIKKESSESTGQYNSPLTIIYRLSLSQVIPSGPLLGRLSYDLDTSKINKVISETPNIIPVLKSAGAFISGTLVGKVSTQPAVVYFGDIKISDNPHTVVTLSCQQSGFLDDIKIDTTSKWITASLMPSAGTRRQVDIALSSDCPAGPLKCTMKINTGAGVILVPLIAYVTK